MREALARNPLDAGARLNLVAERLQEEKPAEALALLNEVDPPADDLPAARHWHLQRALALIALGRPDKARTALGEFDALGPAPPELVPMRLWRDVLLALAENRRADARASAVEMEAALEHMGPGAVLEHRIMARYDLAKFWSREGDGRQGLRAMARGARAAAADPAVFARRRRGPISMRRSRLSRPSATLTALARKMPIRRRCSSSACRARARRSPSRLSPPIRRRMAPGERPALGRLAWRLGAGEDAESIARIARARPGDARRGSGGLSQGIACARAGQNPHRRQDAGQLFPCLADRAFVPEGENHPLHARSARHRLVDLHLPLSRRARLRPRSRRSRLDDRRAGKADEALEGAPCPCRS